MYSSQIRFGWKKVSRLGVLTLMFVALYPVSVTVADCENEEVLFVRAPTSDADGARGVTDVRDRALNEDCQETQNVETHTTAHVRSASLEKFAEVGWVERFSSGLGHRWNTFWETKTGSAIRGGFNTGVSIGCCNPIEFKVVSVADTQKWKFYFDYYNNGEWVMIGPSDGEFANFDHGIPMGETGRRGGDGTGAKDSHRQLQRKLCGSCNWNPWLDNELEKDTIGGFYYVRRENDKYEVCNTIGCN